MLLSKSCEYAIRATVYVAFKTKKNERVGIVEISEAIGSPMHFTGKILQNLTKRKVLSSIKGPHGGFFIDDNRSVFLIDIVRAIDGNDLFSACALGLEHCSDTKPCPMHDQIKPIRNQLLLEFTRKSVDELVSEYEQNRYFLK